MVLKCFFDLPQTLSFHLEIVLKDCPNSAMSDSHSLEMMFSFMLKIISFLGCELLRTANCFPSSENFKLKNV